MRPWFGTAVAFAATAFALSRYQSYADRRVLGRWSPEFAAVLAAMVLCVLAALWLAKRSPPRTSSGVSRSFEWGMALLGTGIMVAAVDDVGFPERILRGGVLATSSAPGLILTWCGLGALLLALAGRIVGATRMGHQGIGAAIIGLGFLLWLGEGVARAQAILFPSTQGYPTLSAEIWLRRYASLNSIGFRDSEHSLVPDDGRFRLAIIGDSFAFGVGINEVSSRLGEQVGQALQAACPADRWEVLNFSRPDTHTLEHEAFLRQAIQYRPMIVLLEYVFNDADYLTARQYGDPMAAVESFRQRVGPLRLAFHNSVLVQQLYVRVRALTAMRDVNEMESPYDRPELLRRHLDDLALLGRIADSSSTRLVVVPVNPAVVADSAMLARYVRVVQAMHGHVEVISTAEAFQGVPFDRLTVNALDRHPSPEANSRVALVVASRLGVSCSTGTI